jgi:hypothetical protein
VGRSGLGIPLLRPRTARDSEPRRRRGRFTEVEGEQCDYPFVLGAYKALYHWGKERGRKLSGSPREIYFFKPGRTPRMEIAFPLQ